MNIIFLKLSRLYFALLFRMQESAIFLRTFMFSGELSFLARDASSLNTTSRHQWRLFSMAQCLRAAPANSSRLFSEVMK